MDESYQIVYVEKAELSAWGIIGEGVYNFNTQQYGRSAEKRLCFVVQTPDQDIVGGVLGLTYWDWFYIELMWVKDELRGQGYGRRLMTIAEDEARKRGVKNAYLDTFSFQAPTFYKKLGYKVFGELQNFPPGHTRYFLQKQL